ncbi:MAG TPA: radical SAM protein [Anaeromyxobacter sp.]|nr:radical SAM protein [Anaeromyxobacter sp.]
MGGEVQQAGGERTDAVAGVVRELRVALSARAEYRCSCCALPGAEVPEGVLDAHQILTLVAAFASLGVRRVRLTGGAPETRPDLVRLLERIRAIPGVEDVALTTSALHLAVLASRYRAAGVSRLGVRVDTLDAARLHRVARRGASLADLVRGVEAAAAAGFDSLKLDTVVMRGVNDAELPALARFAWRHGAVPRFIELMPYGRGDPVPVAEMKRALAAGGVRLSPESPGGFGSTECLRGEVQDGPGSVGGPIRLVGPMSPDRCRGCRRVRVGPDGAMRACLARPVETRLAPLLRDGAGVQAIADHVAAALGGPASSGAFTGTA